MMDLWVMSQDKMNLIKIKELSVDNIDKTNILGNFVSDNFHIVLGTYETPERTLEVLDNIKCFLNSGRASKAVYEMPEK